MNIWARRAVGTMTLLLVVVVALAAVSAAQDVYPEELSQYLPPPRTYLPPSPDPIPGSHVEELQLDLPPEPSAPIPTYDNRIIYFEEGHLINKAAEPGVCNQICASGSNVVRTWVKAGTCPAPAEGPFKGPCKTECKYDSECPDSQKCCDNGCAKVCIVPDFHKRCADLNCEEGTQCVEYPFVDARCISTQVKPDLCPPIFNNTVPIGGCEDSCTFDAECDGVAKCCFNGCANKCLQPKKMDCETFACKVGYECKEDRYGDPYCERIRCSHDGEVIDIGCNSCTCIHGFLLCSQEDCPPIKPGFCPRVVKGYKGHCVETCTMDLHCPDALKCCSTGCGDTCQKPVKGITHPCKTVRFRCGDETICAATRGFCHPGEPCPLSPLCVGKNVPYCASCPHNKVCVLQKQPCPKGAHCHYQPICIQLYSDDTIFEENEDVEIALIEKQQGRHYDEGLYF